VLAYVKRLFRWAASRDLIELDPAAHILKRTAEKKRDRVLSDAEVLSVWEAAGRVGGAYGNGVRLLVATGARREEIFGLRWSEVDREAAVIRLPAERNKVKEPRSIPLSPLALSILDELPPLGEFALSAGGRRPFSGFGKCKARLDGLAGVTGWRVHDLRRTVATGLQRLGLRLEVIEAVLGHVSGSRAGIVGTYQRHRFEDETRAALVAWGEHVSSLLAGRGSGPAVPLRRTA
jgi:integrase